MMWVVEREKKSESDRERESERIKFFKTKKKVNFEAGGYLLEWEKMKKEE